MALQLTTSTQKVIRTTALAPASGDYTAVFWAKLTAVPTGYVNLLTFINVGYTAWQGIFTAGGGASTIVLDMDNGGAGATTTAVQIFDGKWHAIAWTRSGTTNALYVDGLLINSQVLNMAAVTWSQMIIGDDGSSENNFELFALREYTSALTLTQLIAEWNSVTPVLASYSNYTFASNTNDTSGMVTT